MFFLDLIPAEAPCDLSVMTVTYLYDKSEFIDLLKSRTAIADVIG